MFEAPRSGIGLEVEVPEPMHVFKTRVVHPDNEQLILAAQDARLLTPARLKKYRLRGEALKLVLAALGYDQIQTELDTLQSDYATYRAAVHDARLTQRGLDHLEAWVIDLEIEQLKRANAELIQDYTRLQRLLVAPRTPTPVAYVFMDRFHPVRRLVKDILASDLSLRKMARQLEHIRQRLAEHQDAVEQQKQREILCKEMAKEARVFGKIIQRRWAALGFCYRYTIVRGGKSKTVTNLVKFSRIEVTEDEIHLKVDVTSLGLWGETHNNMPVGVAVGKLLASEVLDDLTVACQRQVVTPHDEDKADYINGAWITVNRLGSTDGLMDYIPLKPVMATYKRDWHDQLPFPMGVRRGRVVNWIRLADQPHLMVAGQTGAGKSNVFNVFISTAITMHSPDELRLMLCDLKEGVGFLKYQGLPHVVGDVMTELDQLDQTLQRLEKLRYQRTLQIRALTDNLDDYNRMVAPEHRLTRIVLICDEYQEVASPTKEIKDRIHTLTHKIAAKGRNVGIHLFLGTQSPYSDMIPGKIKANITLVLSGRQRTLGASLSTFGSKIATELPKIKGRMICDDGNDVYQVQIPHAAWSDLEEAMVAAHTWEPARPLLLPDLETSDETLTAIVFDETKLIDYVVDCLHLELKAKPLFEALGQQYGLTYKRVQEMVKAIIDQGTVDHRGNYYTIQKLKNWYVLKLQTPDVVGVIESAE